MVPSWHMPDPPHLPALQALRQQLQSSSCSVSYYAEMLRMSYGTIRNLETSSAAMQTRIEEQKVQVTALRAFLRNRDNEIESLKKQLAEVKTDLKSANNTIEEYRRTLAFAVLENNGLAYTVQRGWQ